MLTDDIKRSIDKIWDTLWAGGLTNPLTDVEQITYLLFMKLLDDSQTRDERNAALLETPLENPVFGAKEEPLRWKNFRHLAPEEMLACVRDRAFPFIKTLGRGRGNAFAEFMKDAVFLIPTPLVLVTLVDEIESMDLSDKDAMGDVYEELLNRVASSGTNGQFRTPRHLTELIVDMCEPTLDDTMIDPAMGSAGFLLSVINNVKRNSGGELMKAANMKKFKSSLVSGRDTDHTMLRIGAMNLMLHGIDNPDIAYCDSVGEDNTVRGKYTLICANPPFTGTIFQNTVAKDLLALTKTGKTELLFLSLFVKLLRIGGRCGSIVPQGVLFGSSTAHVAIRKELVENQRLIGVLSLPSGVFQPYSGVATAVLFFQRTDNGGTDKVWFYDMKADGYSLDQKREPVKANDIPDVLAKFKAWKAVAAQPTEKGLAPFLDRKSTCFCVPKEEIVANGYDLSFNKYKQTDYVAEQFPPTEQILGEIDALYKSLGEKMKGLKGAL